MKTGHYIIIAILLFMVGCSTVQPSKQQPSKEQPSKQQPKVLHQYELSVVDVDGHPLEGVKIEYTLKDYDRIVKSSSYTTASDGLLRESLNVTANPMFSYSTIYKSEIEYKASKSDYYSISGKMSSTYGPENTFDKSKPVEKNKLTLIRPTDYFNKEFASTISDSNLKTRVLSFIDLIILQDLVGESVLKPQSVNLVSFKDKNYLQFRFTNINVFNSLKFNNYDIGKRFFDDVIRKALSPINEYIGNSNLFYGYDLVVVGYVKRFVGKNATVKPIEYRFMIPESVVREYKNKDVSGQQVLNASIILMDDERIELKLQ